MQRHRVYKRKIWFWMIIVLLIVVWVGYIDCVSLSNYMKARKRYNAVLKQYENKLEELRKYEKSYDHLYRIYEEILKKENKK